MTAPQAVLVVGFRVTGHAVAQFLRGRGDEVIIAEDDPTAERRQQADALGARFLGQPDEATLRQAVEVCRLVVPSPGIPVSHPVYRLAESAGVPVHSELELGWERLAARASAAAGAPAQSAAGEGGRVPIVVAVTGTNGKTTVTSLVAAMLVASGRVAVTAGNIGPPFIDAAGLDADVLVTEVSSFQLQYTERFRPAVSCWLNLAEDHLDWHPTMAHYAAAKAKVWAAQGPGDVAVLNADDPTVMESARHRAHGVPDGVRQVTFAGSDKGTGSGTGVSADFYLDCSADRRGVLRGPDGVQLVATGELPRSLPIDVANALAATATALAAGASVEGCRSALRSFQGLPHRVELVAQAAGVGWYDDSKSTTPASVLAAVAGFDSVVLIAGGRNKGLDLSVLAKAVPPVRRVVAIGEAAGEVEAAFAGQVLVTRAHTMAEAVAAAQSELQPGDVVLLSPGCASFDWYRSYAERGDEFARLAAQVAEAQPPGAEGSPQ